MVGALALYYAQKGAKSLLGGKGKGLVSALTGKSAARSAQVFGLSAGPAAGPRRKGKPGTKTGMMPMPARLPNARQWKKINGRLHEYRSTAIGIVNRTGGMKPRRGYRGPKRRARR